MLIIEIIIPIFSVQFEKNEFVLEQISAYHENEKPKNRDTIDLLYK